MTMNSDSEETSHFDFVTLPPPKIYSIMSDTDGYSEPRIHFSMDQV